MQENKKIENLKSEKDYSNAFINESQLLNKQEIKGII
jgi:hypothetical protein